MYRLDESHKLLGKVYQNAAIGSASASRLIPAANNKRLSHELKRQKEGYDNIASTAKVYLGMMGKEPPMTNIVGGTVLRAGKGINLVANHNNSRVASLRITSSCAGADIMRGQLERHPGSDSYANEIASRLISFEEQNIAQLQRM